MQQGPWTVRLGAAAASAALALGSAFAASGQAEPWRAETLGPVPPPARATSTTAATAPTVTENRDARQLATAVFARPAAAQRAAAKADLATQPVLPAPEPKPEWRAEGLQPGGKGMEIKTPF